MPLHLAEDCLVSPKKGARFIGRHLLSQSRYQAIVVSRSSSSARLASSYPGASADAVAVAADAPGPVDCVVEDDRLGGP